MTNILQDLFTAYVEIVKNEPDVTVAANHMLNFVEDVRQITAHVQQAVQAARTRAASPTVS